MEPYIRRPRPVDGRAEEPSCRSWFNHPIRVVTANYSKDTRACLNGLERCEHDRRTGWQDDWIDVSGVATTALRLGYLVGADPG
jgi:hypothetical protein